MESFVSIGTLHSALHPTVASSWSARLLDMTSHERSDLGALLRHPNGILIYFSWPHLVFVNLILVFIWASSGIASPIFLSA